MRRGARALDPRSLRAGQDKLKERVHRIVEAPTTSEHLAGNAPFFSLTCAVDTSMLCQHSAGSNDEPRAVMLR
jgi:hypothetical protein